MYRIHPQSSNYALAHSQWIESVWPDVGFALPPLQECWIYCSRSGFAGIGNRGQHDDLLIRESIVLRSAPSPPCGATSLAPHDGPRHMAIHGFIGGDGYPGNDGSLHFGSFSPACVGFSLFAVREQRPGVVAQRTTKSAE